MYKLLYATDISAFRKKNLKYISIRRLSLCLLGCLFFALFLTGCATRSSEIPDLQKLYALQKGNPEQPPVILIHGISGSRLQDSRNNMEIWPGSINKILFSRYQQLRNDIDPLTLNILPSPYKVTGITDQAIGRDFYGQIIKTLTSAGGFELATLDSASPKQQSLYVFTYDWRQS